MSLYDDYFTNEDKPFAENFNDALLLSNVFDLTVPIELPKMFNNGEWSTGTGQRKAGVSIIQTEGIDGSNVIIENYEDGQGNEVCELYANIDATVLITVYPNFNQYGNLQKVYWEFGDGSDENLTVDVLTEQGTSLLTNIPNNSVLSSVPYLQQLNRFILRLNFEGGTGIKKLGFIMQNKEQDRYGAEVGISDVNGLNEQLTDLDERIGVLEDSGVWNTVIGQNSLHYIKKAGVVFLNGYVTLPYATSSFTLQSLPKGFRPTQLLHIPLLVYKNEDNTIDRARLEITSAGNMNIYSYSVDTSSFVMANKSIYIDTSFIAQ